MIGKLIIGLQVADDLIEEQLILFREVRAKAFVEDFGDLGEYSTPSASSVPERNQAAGAP
jgi:hypothetical protein